MEPFGQVHSYEAIFFRDRATGCIAREMLYAEFEAILDGVVGLSDCAGKEMEAVYALISRRLELRALVFFLIRFEDDGYADPSWNVPLQHLADIAELGPDLGGGPVRIACRGHCNISWHDGQLWAADVGPGSAVLEDIRQTIVRNKLGLLSDETEPVAAPATHAAATEQPAPVSPEADTGGSSGRMQELLQQQVERVHKLSREHAQQLDALAASHQSELELLEQQIQDLRARLRDAQELSQKHQKQCQALAAKLEADEQASGASKDQEAALRDRLQQEIQAEAAQQITGLQESLSTREAQIEYLKEIESQLREELSEARDARQELLNEGGGSILERLHKAGVVFVAYHPGVGHMPVPLKDVAGYVDSPEAYVAAKCNVSEQQYREWRAHWENPVCQGKRIDGQPCTERLDRVDQPARYVPGKSNLCVVCQSRGGTAQSALG